MGGVDAWVTAEILTVLVNGAFLARIDLPDLSDTWQDWFSWQDEGTDWRRREHSKAPPKKWKWIKEGEDIEVEVSVGLAKPNPYPSPNPHPHPHPDPHPSPTPNPDQVTMFIVWGS